MAKYFWVRVRFQSGRTQWYCVPGKVGRQCFRPSFVLLSAGERNESLGRLTGEVNALIEAFVAEHPDQDLRILETEEETDHGGQLAFAFVGTDQEVSIPDFE
jgi:hypothetical protein